MKLYCSNAPLAPLLSLASLVMAAAAWAQTSPLLSLQTIQTTPGGAVEFTFHDDGTGATNYVVEFSPALDTQEWRRETNAVITSLGAGDFRVNSTNPGPPQGFYRVVGFGGGGPIIIEFSTVAFQVVEGDTVLPTLVLNWPFKGIVHYTVSGTAMNGDVVALTGQVAVNGTTATIPVSLKDNETIGQLKYLTLRLEAGPGYQLGASSTTTIAIEENDANWQGSFMTDDATLGFLLTIQQSNGVHTASLKSGGFGFFPATPTPVALLFTTNQFSASASGIPMPAGATLLNEPMLLSLSLSATRGVTNQSVSPTLVEGMGTLISVVPARPNLNTTNTGTFRLLKPPVSPSTNQVELAATL